eukprot:2877974-Rhodomonas_salina.2
MRVPLSCWAIGYASTAETRLERGCQQPELWAAECTAHAQDAEAQPELFARLLPHNTNLCRPTRDQEKRHRSESWRERTEEHELFERRLQRLQRVRPLSA